MVAALFKKPLQQEDVLSYLRQLNGDLDLETVLSLIKYVVPHHMVWSREINDLLSQIFLNDLKNLSQLVSFGASLDSKQSERRIYCEYVKILLLNHDGYLKKYLEQSSKIRFQEQIFRKLFAGSTVYNFLADTVDVTTYIKKLCDELKLVISEPMSVKEMDIMSSFISSFVSFHKLFVPAELFSTVFLTDQTSFESFLNIMSRASLLSKRKVISGAMLRYLESKCTPDTFLSILAILKRSEIESIIDSDEIYNFTYISFQELIISLLLLPKITELIKYLLTKFIRIDTQTDEKTCTLFVLILKKYTTDEQKEYICHLDTFLNAVTKRLSEKDRIIRERTMFIAKLASKDQIQYDSDFTIDIDSFVTTTNIFDKRIEWDKLNASTMPKQVSQVGNKSNHIITLDKLSIEDSDDEEEEGDDDDNGYVFMKDLATAFEKQTVPHKVKLLKNVIRLVRQKKDFQTEVNYFAPQLLSSIALLNNDISEKQFEEYRVNALVSIIVIVPDNIKKLYEILFNSELSLQQRMSLLLSVSMASRELRGYKDEQILKPEYDFPTAKLPWHNDAKQKTIQEIHQTSLVGPGKTVWKSKKLLQSHEQILNRFRDYASKFFYPLANGWLNGIKMGTFDKLFKMYYLNTLRTVYECANPVHDYETMTITMHQILDDASAQDIPLEIQ